MDPQERQTDTGNEDEESRPSSLAYALRTLRQSSPRLFVTPNATLAKLRVARGNGSRSDASS
jgi:hypothetical protein